MNIDLIIIRAFHFIALAAAILVIVGMAYNFRLRIKAEALEDASNYEKKILRLFWVLVGSIVIFIWTV